MSVNKSVSPPLNQRHRILIQQRSVPAGLASSKPIKFQLPRYPEEQTSRQGKPVLNKTAAVDHLTGLERMESVTRDSSLGGFETVINARDLLHFLCMNNNYGC